MFSIENTIGNAYKEHSYMKNLKNTVSNLATISYNVREHIYSDLKR